MMFRYSLINAIQRIYSNNLRRTCSNVTYVYHSSLSSPKSNSTLPWFLPSLGSLVFASLQEENEKTFRNPIKIIEPPEFSHTFQLRQASVKAADSASVLLSQTVQALKTGCDNYSQMLEVGIEILTIMTDPSLSAEVSLQIDEKLIDVRTKLLTLKNQLHEMKFVFEQTCQLLHATASILFLLENETTSSIAASLVYNTQQEVEKLLSKVTDLENRYLELQKTVIDQAKS